MQRQNVVDPDALADEQRRLRELRMAVDLAANVIAQGHLPRVEAEALVAATRRHTLTLFPDKARTFDLILAPRFARLLDEFADGQRQGGRMLPFRRAPS
jgi:hypothetical protein